MKNKEKAHAWHSFAIFFILLFTLHVISNWRKQKSQINPRS